MREHSDTLRDEHMRQWQNAATNPSPAMRHFDGAGLEALVGKPEFINALEQRIRAAFATYTK